MAKLPIQIQSFAERKGEFLETSEIGFSQKDALEVLELLGSTGACVYGGDVYRKENGTWVPAYDNWYCEPVPAESELDFSARSRRKARDYISHYPIANADYLFVLVF